MTLLDLKNSDSFCYKLQNLEKNEAISYDESNTPIIMHGLNESERKCKRACTNWNGNINFIEMFLS